MPVDAKQYAEDLLKEAGVSDDVAKQAIQQFFGNEKVAKKLSTDVMMQSDYNRSMDQLRKEKQDQDQKAQEYYQRSLKEYNDALLAKQSYEQKAATLGINPDERPIVATPTDSISKKDFEETLQKRDQIQLDLLKKGLKLTSQHYHEFKEPLDTEVLADLAIQKGYSLVQAYDEMVKPKRDEAQKTKYEADIAKAKQDGATEALSKHHIPVDSKPKGFAPVFAPREQPLPKEAPLRERALREGFLEEYNKASATSGG